MNLGFDWSLLGAPLLAGLAVTATHAALGREVLKRGIIFIDLTIAQIAALGVILAEMLEFAHGGWQLQLAAGLSALLAAALLAWTERRLQHLQEALIGCLYMLAACISILVLARNPHGTEHMNALLAGQILWVGYGQVWPTALLSAVVLAAWFGGARRRPAMFYLLFALSVTASVQLVGVYLVFASLILPALAAHGLGERRGLWMAYGVSALGYASGLWLSVPFDLPSGPLIVCTLAALTLLCAGLRKLQLSRHPRTG